MECRFQINTLNIDNRSAGFSDLNEGIAVPKAGGRAYSTNAVQPCLNAENTVVIIDRKPMGGFARFFRRPYRQKFVSDQGDKFWVRGFSLGIADRIAEKSLERIQIASVPGDFDGMADGTLHTAGGGLECFRHLGVEHLGDGIGVLTARLGAF